MNTECSLFPSKNDNQNTLVFKIHEFVSLSINVGWARLVKMCSVHVFPVKTEQEQLEEQTLYSFSYFHLLDSKDES